MQDIAFLRKKLQESRDAAEQDYLMSQDLPHPIPHEKPYVNLPSYIFEDDFDRQLQTHWPAYLRWSWRMLNDVHAHKQQLRQQEQEEAQADEIGLPRQKQPRSRTWSLIPNRGWGCSSIQIDSVGLAALLGSQKLETELLANGYALWWAFFNLNKVVNQQHRPPRTDSSSMAGHRFWGSIRSDGVSCSILLERPNRTVQQMQATDSVASVGANKQQYVFSLPPFARIVALDPGPKDPITGVVDGDRRGGHQVIHVSGKQFRAEAWYGRAKQRRERRLKRSPGMQDLLTGVPNYHTPCVNELCGHIQYVLQHLEALRGHAGQRVILKDK